MKPHVLTRTTSASSPSPRSVQPPAARRAASSSESTSLRAQPSVTRLTVRELDTNRGYVIAWHHQVTAPAPAPPPGQRRPPPGPHGRGQAEPAAVREDLSPQIL